MLLLLLFFFTRNSLLYSIEPKHSFYFIHYIIIYNTSVRRVPMYNYYLRTYIIPLFPTSEGSERGYYFFFFANSLLVFTHDDTNLFNILHTLSIITLC